MGLAGIDVERAAAGVAAHHAEACPLPGRDLSGLLTGAVAASAIAAPLYFMTEDDVTRGLNQTNVLTGKPFSPVNHPSNIESVITICRPATAGAGVVEAQPLLRTARRMEPDHGIEPNPFAAGSRTRLRDAQPHRRPRRASQQSQRRGNGTEPTRSSLPSANENASFPHCGSRSDRALHDQMSRWTVMPPSFSAWTRAS